MQDKGILVLQLLTHENTKKKKTPAAICPTKLALPDIYFTKNMVFEFKGSSLKSGG
jgi:hypothetical protein